MSVKLSLRSLFNGLVIPLAGALLALLVAGLMPFFTVQNDIDRLEADLACAQAVTEFVSAFTEQTREYADLIVFNGEREEEARLAAGKARASLARWRKLAPDDGTESGVIATIERSHRIITAHGETVIRLAKEGRRDEAAAVASRQIYPESILITRAFDRSLTEHHQQISHHVWGIVGGIEYAHTLRFGGLREGIDDLDSHVAEVLESAALRTTIEREIRGYWYFVLASSHRDDSPIFARIAVQRHGADEMLIAWRKAISKDGGAKPFATRKQKEELRLVEEVEREYRLLRRHGDDVIRLIEQESDLEARLLLVRSLEFDQTPAARTLEKYINHETEVVSQDLEFLKREIRRLRSLLLAGSIAAALLGLAVPWMLSRKIITPLENLQRAAARIGRGDLETQVDLPSIREMANLAITFNEMACDLRSSRHTLQRFHLAASATDNMIWDLDLRTQEAWVTDSFRTRLGIADSGIVPAEAWTAMMHPDDREPVLAGLRRACERSDSLWSDEYRVKQQDGTIAFVFDRATIVRDADGRAIRIVGTTMDVTERQTAALAIADLNRQKQMILDSVGDGILGIDAEGTVISANPAAATMLGYELADLPGMRMSDILHREDSALRRTLSRGTLEKSDEENFVRADGSTFPVEYTSNAMGADTVVGAVVTFRDVTETHEVERIKKQFVSTVSHELRTPLTSIRGALGLVRGSMLGSLSEKGQRMLEIAASNTDRLVRLINDILDIERLDSGQVALDRKGVDAAKLMQQARDVMKPIADKSGIELRVVSSRATIFADHDRLMQTFTNLLSNAIKFSPAGTAITMTAEGVDGSLRFGVSDQGRGVPAEKRLMIFERFQQVDASDSRDKGGTGLGLAICRSIVQQHGGKIWVESVLGQGSTFYFTVPLQEEESGHCVAPGYVLVCDDDPSVRQVLRELLHSRGYEVSTAESGSKAIALAKASPPSAILLDLLMPDMSGWEVMAALKEWDETKDVPILIASVLSRAEAGPQAGALCDEVAGWICKPLNEEHLFETLERVAGHPDVESPAEVA